MSRITLHLPDQKQFPKLKMHSDTKEVNKSRKTNGFVICFFKMK